MRMVSLDFEETFPRDITWATRRSVVWTQVESTLGAICACVPNLRSLLVAVTTNRFRGTLVVEPNYRAEDNLTFNAGPWPGKAPDQACLSEYWGSGRVKLNNLPSVQGDEHWNDSKVAIFQSAKGRSAS